MPARLLLLIPLLLLPLALPAGAQSTGVREVSASDRTVIPLHTRLRYTTMVILPDDEEILDVVCGDRDFWVISATQNIAHIKPAKEGAATNVNLVTARGTVYSFLLTEGKTELDLKMYVTADPNRPAATPKYVSANELATVQAQVTEARAAVETAQHKADDAIATFKHLYPATLQFVYGTPKYAKPFYVRSIWHDGQFTYIKTDARELPALYEVSDGQASLVNFQVLGGTYVIPKVIERGYLALGKDKFPFQEGR
jgi:type IV secretion system protein VirB9